MNVKFYMSDTYVCGHIRGEVPARALNSLYNGIRVDCKTDILCSDFYGTDLMVFQRTYTSEILEKLKIAKSMGIKTVYDLDDDIFNLPPSFKKPYHFYSRSDIRKITMNYIREVDAITVSTIPLGKVIRKLTPKPSYLVENAIDLDRWRDAQIRRQQHLLRDHDTIVIGWMASGSHFLDIPIVASALLKIFKKYPNVELRVIGTLTPRDFKKHGITDHLTLQPWGEINELPFQMIPFDIAIAPLACYTFNCSKSGLKWMQYSALGIPCLCSKQPAYRDLVGPEFLVEDDCWFKALDKLISNEKFRREAGIKALQSVQAYDINKKAGAWLSAWRHIVNGGV